MRLDKYLSDMGAGTRSELKKLIKKGYVTVDQKTVNYPGFHVTEDSEITCKGQPVRYEKNVYYMLNKPAGIISASDDPREETVVDLITGQKRKDLFPVGRLDRDTEGLLLITNDGELAHRLLSPRRHVGKTYIAQIRGNVTEEDITAFGKGLELPDGLECMPAGLKVMSRSSEEDITHVRITIHEGKFHQIKRMFLAVGKEVVYLKRISMGSLELDPELDPGDFRRLTDKEIKELRELKNT